MNQNTAENRNYFEPANDALFEEAASPDEKFSYARALRTLGRALEKHRFSAFDLRVEDDTYVIKGSIAPVKLPKPSRFRSFRDLFRKPSATARQENHARSEERRVGKECRL